MSDTISPCAKCGHEVLFVVDPVRVPSFGLRHSADTLPAVTTVDGTRRRDAGQFEARICAQCGFTEWYTKRLHELRALAAEDELAVDVARAGDARP